MTASVLKQTGRKMLCGFGGLFGRGGGGGGGAFSFFFFFFSFSLYFLSVVPLDPSSLWFPLSKAQVAVNRRKAAQGKWTMIANQCERNIETPTNRKCKPNCICFEVYVEE